MADRSGGSLAGVEIVEVSSTTGEGVGALREKLLAAHRAGLKVVMLPQKNLKDLVDVPKRVRTDLKIIPVEHMDQVLERPTWWRSWGRRCAYGGPRTTPHSSGSTVRCRFAPMKAATHGPICRACKPATLT